MTENFILPVGFYDLIGPEAKRLQDLTRKLLDEFGNRNYQMIKTPLMEFGNNLSSDDKSDLFAAYDNFSGKSLAVRNDITPQINRLLSTKLKDALLPIRLCYVGDVVLRQNNHLYDDRQLTQIGAELIGDDNPAAEIINLVLSSLLKIGLNGIIICFSFPSLLEAILTQQFGVVDADLKEAILQKNISKINDLCIAGNDQDFGKIITQIILENSDLGKIIKLIMGLNLDENWQSHLQNWQKNLEDLQKDNLEISFKFDLLARPGSSYHREVAFEIFAENFSYPIAKGGKYLAQNGALACGFSIYADYLLRISGE